MKDTTFNLRRWNIIIIHIQKNIQESERKKERKEEQRKEKKKDLADYPHTNK